MKAIDFEDVQFGDAQQWRHQQGEGLTMSSLDGASIEGLSEMLEASSLFGGGGAGPPWQAPSNDRRPTTIPNGPSMQPQRGAAGIQEHYERALAEQRRAYERQLHDVSAERDKLYVLAERALKEAHHQPPGQAVLSDENVEGNGAAGRRTGMAVDGEHAAERVLPPIEARRRWARVNSILGAYFQEYTFQR